MKYIFPQNYTFKNKLFGIIDYSTLILNVIWDAFIFCLLDIFVPNISIKISCFIILCFPLLLFSIIGFNGENIIYVFSYIIKFMLKPKILLYK